MADDGSARSRRYDASLRVQTILAPRMPLEGSRDVAGALIIPTGPKRKQVTMNHKSYLRLDCAGKGGSARVYRVMTENFKMLALKRVSLRDVDEIGVQGLKGEIDLLKKLANVDRVVKLFDWELNVAANQLNLVGTPVSLPRFPSIVF